MVCCGIFIGLWMVWLAAYPFVMNLTRNNDAIMLMAPTTTGTTTTDTTTTTATTTTTTTSTTTTTTTTTATATTSTAAYFYYTIITRPNDIIMGVFNTTAGSITEMMIGGFPDTEPPKNAIDMNTGTKYLNFGGSSGSSTIIGLNTGYYVIPRVGSSIATGIIFTTANDSPNRDPTRITLEGSNDGCTRLQVSGRWTLIYAGLSGISATNDPGRQQNGTLVTFNNTIPYMSYRLLITSKRGSENSVQYSEARIMGYI